MAALLACGPAVLHTPHQPRPCAAPSRACTLPPTPVHAPGHAHTAPAAPAHAMAAPATHQAALAHASGCARAHAAQPSRSDPAVCVTALSSPSLVSRSPQQCDHRRLSAAHHTHAPTVLD